MHDKENIFKEYQLRELFNYIGEMLTLGSLNGTLNIGMILTAVNSQLGLTIMFIGVGGTFVTIIGFSFATPETVKLLGIKRSLLIVRILALIMLF